MKKIKNWYLELSVYYQLIPFLLLYFSIIFIFKSPNFIGDESRYLWFANNLLNGLYSPPYPKINLWNGPGYPLLLSLFLFFKLPLLAIKLFNAILIYLSLIISYKSINIYSSTKSAFVFTVFLGLYFPFYVMLPLILTESLSWFLISLVYFLLIKTLRKNNISWKLTFLTSMAIAYLALVKVIFGYVILSALFLSILILIFPKYRPLAKKTILIFSISILLCLPYLLYTYSLTNKLFYWSNAGGMSLYTMSTPYTNELGDWKSTNELLLNPNHNVFIDSISKLAPLQKDEAFKLAAIENIRSHPFKYAQNWLANVGRILFNYPYSYKNQTLNTFFTIYPNMFVIVFIFFSLVYFIRYPGFVPDELKVLLIFIMIYLFASTLLSAYSRMLMITIPFWAIFISYIHSNIISIKLKNKTS